MEGKNKLQKDISSKGDKWTDKYFLIPDRAIKYQSVGTFLIRTSSQADSNILYVSFYSTVNPFKKQKKNYHIQRDCFPMRIQENSYIL